MSRSWWTDRDYNAEARPEEKCQDGINKLNKEKHRHDEEMERIQKEHEEQMRKLQKSAFQRAKDWIYNLGTRKAENIFGFNSPSEEESCGSSIDVPGSCLIIWNESKGNETQAASLCQAFLNVGFNVEFKKNLSERDTWNLFEKVANARYQDKKCFVLTFVAEGTSEYVKSGDGKKMKLSNIVNYFSPYNAVGLRRTPKLLFFQCNGGNKVENKWGHGDPPFAPKYNDAFVLCSTHSRFLPTLEDFLRRGFVGEFQDSMSRISDVLVRGSTPQESIGYMSTLQTKLFFDQK